MPQGEQKYDASKRRSWRQAVKTKLHMVQQWREGSETVDVAMKVGLAGGIVALQTYLLRLVVVPTPGTGQITLPDGRYAFLTYKGQQIQTLQWTFPQEQVAGSILQMPLVILMGSSGLTLSGGIVSVVATGTILDIILGGGASGTPNSLFFEKTWQLSDIYADMFPRGAAAPSGASPVEIKVDTWVAIKRAKYLGFALGVGAMTYYAWTKMGGALLR